MARSKKPWNAKPGALVFPELDGVPAPERKAIETVTVGHSTGAHAPPPADFAFVEPTAEGINYLPDGTPYYAGKATDADAEWLKRLNKGGLSAEEADALLAQLPPKAADK